MKKLLPFIFIPLVSASCFKEKKEFIRNAPRTYSDGFENYQAVADLYADDRWSDDQVTVDGNGLSFDSTIVHSGNFSLRCSASATQGDLVSKASIFKNDFAVEQGETIEFTGWYYLDTPGSTENIFLADFEDPAYISYSPGFRLMIASDGGLVVERNKMDRSTLLQTGSSTVLFPVRQWVKIRLEVGLSTRRKGSFKLYQDEQLILDHSNVSSLPKDLAFASLGTTGLFRQLEVGLTANSSNSPATLYIDDVLLRVIE